MSNEMSTTKRQPKPPLNDAICLQLHTLNQEQNELQDKINLLFAEHFEFVGYKRELDIHWYSAKYSPWHCAVGDLLQTQSSIFRRMK